jgi:hypothetical protein
MMLVQVNPAIPAILSLSTFLVFRYKGEINVMTNYEERMFSQLIL